MPLRIHTCKYPMCIHEAFQTCKKCGTWLCPDHLLEKKHSCAYMRTWDAASPGMNAPTEGKVEVRTDRKGRVRMKKREWWRGAIER